MDRRLSAAPRGDSPFLWAAALILSAPLRLCVRHPRGRSLLWAAALIMGVYVAAPAPAQAPATRGPIEVTRVEVQDAGPGGLVVVVTADGPIGAYESFTLPDPPRLILDIPNANHAIPQPISAKPPAVTAIRSSQYRERPVKIVRLVFDLRSSLPFQVATVGSQLRVQLGTAVAATPPGPPAPPAPAAAAPGVAPAPAGKVTRVDFQSVRGRQQIVIGTSGRVTYNVTEVSNPPGLQVDVTGATIEPAAARTLDLKQVAAPVNRLQASQFRTDPDKVVRVMAELKGPTRYDVRQSPSAIVVELLTPPPAARAATPAAPPAPASTPAAAPAAPPAPVMPAAGRLSSPPVAAAPVV
jgi:hypothetical protein